MFKIIVIFSLYALNQLITLYFVEHYRIITSTICLITISRTVISSLCKSQTQNYLVSSPMFGLYKQSLHLFDNLITICVQTSNE